MKERLQVIDFKYTVATITFFFFLLISILSPISGTDWINYLVGKEGIKSCIENISIADGRIIHGFLAPFLTYNKMLFNILFSLLISKFVLSCNNMMGYVKNKYYYLFPLIGTLLISVFLFSYNYVSVSTTVTYTFPAIMMFLYFEYLWKKENNKFSKKEFILLTALAIYISLSSLHLAITFLIGNIIYFTYSKISKRTFPKRYVFIILIQLLIISFLILKFNKALLYENINVSLSNLPRYIDTIFSKNILLILLGAIPINYYLNDLLRDWIYKRLVITLFDGILLFSLAYNFFYFSPVNLNLIINKYMGVFATENWYYIFYFLMYIVLFFLSIKHYISNIKTNNMLKNFSIMSLIISVFLLISPVWDEGNVIFIVLFLIMSISILFKELEVKIYKKTTILFLTAMISYYIVAFSMIQYIDYTRGNYINEQLEANQQVVEVKANPIYLVWRHNPVNIFQHKEFKMYYNIPSNTQIVVRYFGIFEEIEKKVKE